MRTPHYTQTTTVPTLFIAALPLHNNNILPSSRLFQNSPPTIHKLKIKSHHEQSTFSSSFTTSHHANQPLRFPFFFHHHQQPSSTNRQPHSLQTCEPSTSSIVLEFPTTSLIYSDLRQVHFINSKCLICVLIVLNFGGL